ncbi:exonuclease 1 [Phragmites australis]|uniref:exonuclease 1 n=1 Tax=Phragmites australis TaxID=29695 RepID=UPI002D778803|nr:exonuclease 1 [Phragmites australis]
MGIPNLLRFLKPFIEPVHIKKYAGKRVGIDAYSWLHKGAYSCSMELCMDPKSGSARRYISYFMHHINLLRHYKVVPVVVFDGGSMPCKAATDKERHRKRELSLALAKEKLEQGNTTAAIDLFRKAVHITPSMAYQLIQTLRSEDVEFVVAPYEADSQLAYLTTLDPDQGGIAAVVTEDSDLIAYCCPAIIFKMDRFGNGEEFIMERTLKTDKASLSFRCFDKKLFTGMCIFAGCDFLPSVSGIGTKRAYSLISKYKNINRVISTLKLDKRYSVPDDYADSLWKTLAVFNHARVYDVKSKSLKHLKPLDEQYLNYLDGDLDILGPPLSPSIARGIAEGHLNPVTLEAFDQYSRTISPIEFIHTSAFKVANQCGSQEMTQKSYIAIFSSRESKENVIVNDISNGGQKCQKGILALGTFILQKHSPPVDCNEVEPKNIPENNPFKKRKFTTDQGQEMVKNELLIDLHDEKSILSCSSLSQPSSHPKKFMELLSIGQAEYERNSVVTETPVSFCSSLTEESVKSMPNGVSSKRQKKPEEVQY